MGWITNKRDALGAIFKFRIIDEVEDHIPPRLLGQLKQWAREGSNNVCGHVRYEGAREIWWFDALDYVSAEHCMTNWPKDLFPEPREQREAA